MPLSTALGEGTVWGGSLSPAGNKHAGPSPCLPVSSDLMVTTGAQETRFYIPSPSPGQVWAQGSLWGDELQGLWALCPCCDLPWALGPLRGLAGGQQVGFCVWPHACGPLAAVALGVSGRGDPLSGIQSGHRGERQSGRGSATSCRDWNLELVPLDPGSHVVRSEGPVGGWGSGVQSISGKSQ